MSEQAANEAGNDGDSVTVALPKLDFVHVRRDLIAKRTKYGADIPIGHRCSNVVSQMKAYQKAPRGSSWRSELWELIQESMAELSKLTK